MTGSLTPGPVGESSLLSWTWGKGLFLWELPAGVKTFEEPLLSDYEEQG